MKILIAEDDFVSRKFLKSFLSSYGDCDVVIDGLEAIDAYMMAMRENNPYDLICLDIMMPKVDGVKVLKAIRDLEMQRNIEGEDCAKIIMITALDEAGSVREAFEHGCEAYASKPVDTEKLTDVINKLDIL